MKIGVYVGSFDPVHKGHTDIIDYLIDSEYIEDAIIVPTENYWDKQNLTDLDKRTDMLKLAFKGESKILVSLSKYEYTYQIMNELNKEYESDEFYLIIGADNVVDFYKWKNYKDILKNHVLVIPRDGIDVSSYINNYEAKDKFILVEDFENNSISSTFIRDGVKNNNLSDIDGLVDKKVKDYIVKNKLYEE